MHVEYDKPHVAAHSSTRKEADGFRTDMNETAKTKLLPCQEGNASRPNHRQLFPVMYSGSDLRPHAAARNKHGIAFPFRLSLISYVNIL
jgi:hypothetical protein